MVGLLAARRLPLVVASGGYSLVARGLLVVAASLIVELRLWVHGLQWLQHLPGLSSCGT